jgi:hypothetical protein
MPGFESAECEDLDDGEAGGITALHSREQQERAGCRSRNPAFFIGRLSLPAKNFPQLAIDLCGALGRFRDQFDPLLSMGRHFQLTEQVGRLHDGFNGIAEVVNEFAQLMGDVGRKFLSVIHGGPAREIFSSVQRLYLFASRLAFDRSPIVCKIEDCSSCTASRKGRNDPQGHSPKWRNWQTRMVQVHVPARVWGFESLLRHHSLRFRS